MGTSTSALSVGGDPGSSAICELWNGTNWTEVNNVNSGRQTWAGAGPDNTSSLVFGGTAAPGQVALTEEWNGASWVEVADLSVARESMGGAGVVTSALAFGGENPGGKTNATEEWNPSSNVVKTLTD